MTTKIGTGPQDIPLNQYLGEMAFMDNLYSEGTYEPELTTSGGDFASVSYQADTGGHWTKIGRICVVTGCLRVTSVNTSGPASTSTIGITLPFPAAARTNGDNADNIGACRTVIWDGTSNRVPTILGVASSTSPGRANLFATSFDTAANTIQAQHFGSGASMIQFSVTYRVAE